MNRLSVRLPAALVLLCALTAGAAETRLDQELPPGAEQPVLKIQNEQMRLWEACETIARVTEWQIICSKTAGDTVFPMYTDNMLAGDMLRAVVRSQGLVYHVEGNVIEIMTPREYADIYGLDSEVIVLKYASADMVANALKPLLAVKGTKNAFAEITPLPQAAAIIISCNGANMKVLKRVIEELDRPLVTEVVSLENALAADVARALGPFITSTGRISADEQANQVIIREVEGGARELAEMARKMDVPSRKETRRFLLKNADCNTVARYLEGMFGLRLGAAEEPVIRTAPAAPQPSLPSAPAAPSAPVRTRGRRGESQRQEAAAVRSAEFRSFRARMARSVVQQATSAAVGTVIADERLNAVWVTDTPERVEDIAVVIEGLDAALETVVYEFSYVDLSKVDVAEQLGGILRSSEFDRVEIDERTRSISVTTTPERAKRVVALLERWDAEPRQVFITGKVLSVNRDKLRELGASYEALVHDMDENVSTEINPFGNFLPAIGASPKGSLRVGNLLEDHFTVLIEALETDSTTKLLSSPRVLVVDGEQAQFAVVTEEPYTEIIFDDESSITRESVKFKKVGITLQVVPSINKDGKIQMLLYMDVSSLQEIREGIPVVSTSNMSSKVIVADGTPVVIGGLIVDEEVNVESKVPLLGDIPIIGNLFKNTRKDRSQRETVLIIVPSIVGTEPAAAEPTLDDVEEDLISAGFLDGETGEGASPAGGGAPSKGRKDDDEQPQE